MTTTNLSKYTWIALLVGAFLVTCTPKAVADETTTTNDWQGQLANPSIGADGTGTDITVSTENNVTTYTVKTPVGLAWIAKVTNEGKKNGDDGADANYPAKAGFEDCIVKLDPTTTPPGNTLDLSPHLWVPIGNANGKTFKGTFDGNHKMITGLTVKVSVTTGFAISASAYAGLFGRLASTSKVSNLGIKVNAANAATYEIGDTPTGEIEASSTTGSSYAGALAGYNEQGTIENCFVSGTGTICSKSTYSSGSAYSGGLIGSNGGTITHCYTTVNVVANGSSSYAGGIIGNIIMGSTFQIKNVYATGKVEATGSSENYAGGITGNYIYGELSNVLALNKEGITGTINTNNKNCGVGRITGCIPKDKESNLTACYASTKIRMNGKVKGKIKNYDYQGNPSDDAHFIDGLTADTDIDLSALLKEGAADNAWTFSADNLPILAGFADDLQTALPKSTYLDAPLDLSASGNGNGSYTLTYSDTDGWKYEKGTSNGTGTSFSGSAKGSATTADLTITNNSATTDDEATLSFANNTSWTAGSGKTALTISENSKPVALFSEGTVTIKGNSSGNFNNSLSVDNGVTCRFAPDNHFHLYGGIATNTSGTLLGLMGWQWNNAPTSDIEVFWTDGSTKIPVASTDNSYAKFATNPGGNNITVKVGDNYQKGKKNGTGSAVSPFNFEDDTNNAYIYYNEMGTSDTKGTKDNPYTVNLANPSAGAAGNGYTYSSDGTSTSITLTSPGSYYSLEGEAATNSTLTLSATATTAYHLLAASGSKANILTVPTGTNCTIEGTNTLAATFAQIEGNLTLNAPVTLAKTTASTTSDDYCLLINNNGSVTVNSTLRATATSSDYNFGTAIKIGDYTNPGTLTIGNNGVVYAYGKHSACYIDNENATLTINNNGILRMASSQATINPYGNINAPIISWEFFNAPNSPLTVKKDNNDYTTFSSEVFGFDISSAKVFATNVAKETDYTLYNNAGKQLSGVNEVNTKTQTFRVKEGVSYYTAVGIPLSNIADNSDMTITNDKYKIGNGEKQDYSGIISGSTLKSLTADGDYCYALLDNVTIGTLTVNANSRFNLILNNTNTIHSITVNGILQIDKNDNGKLTIPANGTVTNNSTLIDNSAQITKVAGAAALEITSPRDATAPTGKAITLTATAVGGEGANVTEQWQKWNAKDNRWDYYSANLTQSSLQLRSATQTKTFTINVTEEGSYRCLITCTKKVSDDKTVTTHLCTKSATATFTTSDGDDNNPGDGDGDYTPVFYTVTLPAVEGATTDPVAGSYEVEAWDSFRFYLTLDAAYDQSTPVVTTGRGETLDPRSSDGAYIVKYVRSDTDIRIDGIVKNTPDVGNEAIASDGVKVWATGSQLHIHTAAPTDIYIYNFSGGLLKQFARLSGDKTIALPQGNYIVVAGNQKFKVQVK